MRKVKGRHNPDKLQNTWGEYCPYYDDTVNGFICERGEDTTELCKGNPHSCIKNLYKREAIKRTK